MPISKKNPLGRTIVDRHLRHIAGQYLDLNLIDETYRSYEKKKIRNLEKQNYFCLTKINTMIILLFGLITLTKS